MLYIQHTNLAHSTKTCPIHTLQELLRVFSGLGLDTNVIVDTATAVSRQYKRSRVCGRNCVNMFAASSSTSTTSHHFAPPLSPITLLCFGFRHLHSDTNSKRSRMPRYTRQLLTEKCFSLFLHSKGCDDEVLHRLSPHRTSQNHHAPSRSSHHLEEIQPWTFTMLSALIIIIMSWLLALRPETARHQHVAHMTTIFFLGIKIEVDYHR